MVGQKERILRRFEREAKLKNKRLREMGLSCSCGSCNLATFKLDEIKDIIYLKDLDEIGTEKRGSA